MQSSQENNLYRRAFVLAILTIVCSTFEGTFSVYYGYITKSLTLFGNGVVSYIEVLSGFGIVVMTSRIRKDPTVPASGAERMALRITGIGLYILAVGLIIMSSVNIITHQHPSSTVSGVIIAIVTIIIISTLVIAKMKVGKQLNSKALIADAKCTRICVYMSSMVLLASIVYELTKFTYADSIGALGLAYFAYLEAKECFTLDEKP